MNAPATTPLAAYDFWRASPLADDIAPGYKEWSHFSILTPEFDLVLNLSFARAEGAERAVPRAIVMFGDAAGRWDGEIVHVPLDAVRLIPGSPDVTMGPATTRLNQGRYRIEADLPKRGLRFMFELTPNARPLVGYAIRLSDTETINWVVVPHLRATGEVFAGGRRYAAVDAPAYHDRNWGTFTWGGDFAWEWATLVPDQADAPALVFSRTSDRARGLTFSQSLMLWRKDRPARRYFGRDVTVSAAGALRPERVFRLPRFSGLIGSGRAADVPRHMSVAARGYGDALDVEIELDRLGQILTPNDRWPGLTALSEVGGRFRAEGRVGGVPVSFAGRAQVEFKHGAT